MKTVKPLKLFWSGGRENVLNYGDILSPVLVEMLSRRKVVYASPQAADLCAIGSILQRVCKGLWSRPLYGRLDRLLVWGSGAMRSAPPIHNRLLDIRAVRGPLSRDLAGLSGDIPLGDPGLLAPLLIDGAKIEPKHAFGIVPHVSDFSDPQVAVLAGRLPHAAVIDLANPDVAGVTKQIASCEVILSSSLHGLIVADALQIPNVRLKFADRIRGGDWKFDDHALSVAKPVAPPMRPWDVHAIGLDERLLLGSVQTIDRLKDGLVKSFASLGF